ncbi:MAG: glutamate--tRNA ligase [Clostridiales bacterium]|nr:glutamate--tRNA ligase [Clostridiales bacterium]
MTTVRTRFAPSPTGFMHIGNLRTALYTYLYAKANGGKFILRIEDTDQERFVEGATEVIYKTLKSCGMDWDEGPDKDGGYGPYIQSQRKDMYLPYAKELVEKGAAYYCFCTKEELDERRAAVEKDGGTWKYDKHCMHMSKEEIQRRLDAGEPYVIRQNIPQSGEASFDDALYGHISVDCSELDDTVLIKADGLPTYNFANVIDDHTMGITHVLRGNEYLSSTPKYNLLYEAFGWEKPIYMHLTPVMRDATHKLSKRNGDPTFEDLLDMGYLREAILNYVVLVGWNPGNDREFFTLDELVEVFGSDGLSKSPAVFDIKKLTWMNGEYIRRMSHDQFKEVATPWLKKQGFDTEKYDMDIIIDLLQPRTERLDSMASLFTFLDDMPEVDVELYTHKKMKTNPEVAKTALESSIPAFEQIDDWTMDNIHAAMLKTVETLGCKNGQVMWPVRIAITGMASTPGGATEIAALLGKDETVRRLKAALAQL